MIVIKNGKSFKCVFLSLLLILLSCFEQSVKADSVSDSDLHVVIVYSSETGKVTENIKLLDMLIGHFSPNMTFLPSSEIEEADLQNADVLFYYGEVVEVLPAKVGALFDSFTKTKVALGYNVEYLGEDYDFIQFGDNVLINELVLVEGNKKNELGDRLIFQMKDLKEAEVLVKGAGNGKEYPLFIKKNELYYHASYQIDSLFSTYLGEVFHEVFKADHPEGHPAYLRLEDIHPLTDHTIMKEIADIFIEKEIPYIISVIPIYRNPETGDEYHFGDFPKLLEVLKYMQENGGRIILHGYTHQYKADETGEGFEFWDVDANMPITVPPDETPEKKQRSDFQTEDEYLAFLAKQKAFEVEYIKTKVTKGIQDLVSYGLIPYAFEAPHYTMSQSGYEILSEHFSTYIGQLQLGDRDWQIMAPAPYATSPTFLHGMNLLPETIGYVEPDNPHAIDEMMKKAEEMTVVRDGYIAGFYHPYLGVEKFKELIGRMEQIPNLQWIDLQQTSNVVQVDNITVTAEETEELSVNVEYFELLKDSPEFYNPKVKSTADNTMWLFALSAGGMVVLFVLYAVIIKIRRMRTEKGKYYG